MVVPDRRSGHAPIAERHKSGARDQNEGEEMACQHKRPGKLQTGGRAPQRQIAGVAGMPDQPISDHQIAGPNNRRREEAVEERAEPDLLAVGRRVLGETIGDEVVRHPGHARYGVR